MKRLALLLVVLFYSGLAKAQLQAVSFNQLDSLQRIEKRKVVVFVYTDWCGYCKAMEQKVFKQAEIQKLLQSQYYLVALNAEDKNTVSYRGQTFGYKNSKGVHELALSLMGQQKQLSFPFLALINAQDELLYRQEGFISAATLKKVLAYFSTNEQ